MFLFADAFFPIVHNYRMVWIMGRYGGGKTSIAFAIAERYLRQGYRLVTNVRSVWADDPDEVRIDNDGYLRCVVIADEGGIWLKSSAQVQQMLAYAAKMDVVFLIPSYWPPCRDAQVVTLQPLVSLRSAGIPAIFYRWRVNLGGMKDGGSFIWLYPRRVFGVYSRRDPTSGMDDLIRFLTRRVDDYRRHWGRSGVPAPTSDVDLSILSDVAAALDRAADAFERSRPRTRISRLFSGG